MRFDIITIFPEMFGRVFSRGILQKAIEKGLLEVNIHNLRDFTLDKHRQVDDRPFGGCPGMVMKPEPIFTAVEKIRHDESTPVYLLSPQGKVFNSRLARRLSSLPQIILICGRYEGVDERVVQYLIADEISIGDYVLTGGEPAALVVVDSVSRFIPGVVGKMESVQHDSFSCGMYDFPQYTRPREFRGMKVPDVLFSGDHEKIRQWRKRRALEKTWRLRSDLLQQAELSSEEKSILEEIRSKKEGKNDESN